VLKPKDLLQGALYNLDQYLMRGGRIVLCGGNYDASFEGGQLRVTPIDTGLDAWLEHHGIGIGQTLVLDDRNQPFPQAQNAFFPGSTSMT